MTDPTGLCFFSYRRSRAVEAGLIVASLNDHGVPTWQDISDLPASVTESELRNVLLDPQTASAVMLITPEVATSPMIRDVEAPLIIDRHLQNDGFFALPVLAGGLNYSELADVVGPAIGLADISGWNAHRPAIDPIDEEAASTMARLVLRQRVATVHRSTPSGAPLTMLVNTRAPLPKVPGTAIACDLTHRFSGRLAKDGAWARHIQPAFQQIARTLQTAAPGRAVQIAGQLGLPAAVVLGTSLSALSGVSVDWRQDQHVFGQPAEFWSLRAERQDSGFTTRVLPYTPGRQELALVISASADIAGDVRTTLTGLSSIRAVVEVRPSLSSGFGAQLGPAQALDIAHKAVQALRSVRTEYSAPGAIHLFVAAPAGLAFLVGQLLNTFGVVHTYEHQAGAIPAYVRAASIEPSA